MTIGRWQCGRHSGQIEDPHANTAAGRVSRRDPAVGAVVPFAADHVDGIRAHHHARRPRHSRPGTLDQDLRGRRCGIDGGHLLRRDDRQLADEATSRGDDAGGGHAVR
jgi:hypothetical protein